MRSAATETGGASRLEGMPRAAPVVGPYGDDVLQRSGALWPRQLGRGSLGASTLLQDQRFGRVFVYVPAAPGQTARAVPGCGGTRLALLAEDQAAWALDRGLVVTADATRPWLRVACESGDATGEAFLSALGRGATCAFSTLRNVRTGPGAATDAHLGLALGLAFFQGTKAQPARNHHRQRTTGGQVRLHLATRVRVEQVEQGQRPLMGMQVTAHRERGRWRVWRGVGCMDFVLAPFGCPGQTDELGLGTRVALGFTLSTSQGASVDARAAVLQGLLTGVVFEACREAKRRAYVENGRPVPDELAAPVLVLLLRRGWEALTCRQASRTQPADRNCRVYSFTWSGNGVSYRRSAACTVAAAFDHADAHLC